MNVPSLYTVGLLFSVIVAGAVSYLAWRNRPKPMARTLSLALAASVIWCGGLLLIPFVSTPGTVLALFTVALVGMALVVQWCLIVAIQFGGYDRYVNRRMIALTSIQPVLVAAAMVTNERHWLFWSDYRIGDPATLSAARGPFEIGLGQVVVVVNGPGFMLHALYAMVALGATTYLLVQRIRRSGLFFRKQGAVILVGLCGPWVGFGLFLVGVTAVDWTPVGVGLLGTALFVGIFRFGLTELRPIPGETVVRNISSGVVILTGDGRINLANDRARELLGVGPDRELIGRPVSALVGDHAALATLVDIDSGTETLSVTVDGASRALSLTVSPLAVGRQEGNGGATRLFELHDITEEKRRQRDLKRQNERLERYANIVAHDLRNPLVVADGHLDLLADETDGDHVDEIRTAIDRMSSIIDDTQTLTEEGTTVVKRESVSLRAVAEESWAMADTGDATLEIEDDIELAGEFTRLQQALENLFRNAVDHNPEADLTVRVSATEDGWYVEDTGSGIPLEDRERVLEPGESTREEGTGFGLAIVSEIVDAHDWDIAVTESAEGGARFEITGMADRGVAVPNDD